MPDVVILSVGHSDGAELRAKVLRPNGQKVSSGALQYEDADTIHLAAYSEGDLVGTVSFTPYDEQGLKSSDCYQLRGAATRSNMRGQGIGTALVTVGIEVCRKRNISRIWCSGRSVACTFYERLGFRALGHEYTTSTGPHFRFRLDL